MTDQTPEPAAPAAPAPAPWDVAVDAVCTALETYAAWRMHSGDIPGCARQARISRATADRFEQTLDRISGEDDEAAPAEATAETASVLAHHTA